MLGKREIHISEIRETWIYYACPHIGLGHHRKSCAGRTLEVRELDDLDRGIGFANQIALSGAGIGRIDCLSDLPDRIFRFGGNVGERGGTHDNDHTEQPVERLWPT